MEKLRVVDLQKHSRYLTSQAGMHVLDQREQTLTWKREKDWFKDIWLRTSVADALGVIRKESLSKTAESPHNKL